MDDLLGKRYALITGATGGIGSSYAMQLASMGFNLILTSTKKIELDFLKTSLSKKYKITVRTVVADLTKESDIKKVVASIKKINGFSILINNAGFGIGDYFTHTDNDYLTSMVKLHNLAVVDLTHQLLPILKSKNKSYIINVSSLAGFFPFPKSAVYSASKAFLISFSETLHIELKKYNVKVQALCPGFTRTRFFDTSIKANEEVLSRKHIFWMTPQQVVTKSLYDLKNKQNKVICVPGFPNRLMRFIGGLIPRRLYYRIMRVK